MTKTGLAAVEALTVKILKWFREELERLYGIRELETEWLGGSDSTYLLKSRVPGYTLLMRFPYPSAEMSDEDVDGRYRQIIRDSLREQLPETVSLVSRELTELDRAKRRVEHAKAQFEHWSSHGRCQSGSEMWNKLENDYRLAKDDFEWKMREESERDKERQEWPERLKKVMWLAIGAAIALLINELWPSSWFRRSPMKVEGYCRAWQIPERWKNLPANIDPNATLELFWSGADQFGTRITDVERNLIRRERSMPISVAREIGAKCKINVANESDVSLQGLKIRAPNLLWYAGEAEQGGFSGRNGTSNQYAFVLGALPPDESIELLLYLRADNLPNVIRFTAIHDQGRAEKKVPIKSMH